MEDEEVVVKNITLQEVIASADELYPNSYSTAQKVHWLSMLDARIRNDIIDTHEDAPEDPFERYTEDDLTKEMLVPFPYDELYTAYIIAKVDEANRETERYANSSIRFNALYKDYAGDYNKKHKPIAKQFKL